MTIRQNRSRVWCAGVLAAATLGGVCVSVLSPVSVGAHGLADKPKPSPPPTAVPSPTESSPSQSSLSSGTPVSGTSAPLEGAPTPLLFSLQAANGPSLPPPAPGAVAAASASPTSAALPQPATIPTALPVPTDAVAPAAVQATMPTRRPDDGAATLVSALVLAFILLGGGAVALLVALR